MTAQIHAILDTLPFDVRFRPLLDLRSHALLGHEAIVRGPADQGLHTLVALRRAAAAAGLAVELEYALAREVLDRAGAVELPRRLYMGLAPALLGDGPACAGPLAARCRGAGLEPSAIIWKFDAAGLGGTQDAYVDALSALRAQGFGLAIAGLGCGGGDLRLWAELRPDYVEVADYFSGGVESDRVKLEFVRALVDLGRAVGTRVVACEVHDAEQCRELADLGVDAACGPFFGDPTVRPGDAADALTLLELQRAPDPVLTAQQLIAPAPSVEPDLLIRDFVRIVYDQAHRDAFPVVAASGAPVGMIWRNAFLLLYSKPLHPEILGKKPVSTIMDTAPLVIDARLRLEQVSRLVTRKSRAHLTDQFIITRGGVYAGIGHTIDLLHQITKQQITQATHSNPLTALPGNVPINENINRLLGEDIPFVVAYVDLDYFKPYNDAYGYARGDQMLLHVAEILRDAVSPRTDFVGHLGGDDFVMILRSPDWAERLRRLVGEFERSVGSFYSAEHRRAGGIETADRYGERRRFGFLTLSVAIIDTSNERFDSADHLAERLQRVKAKAKSVPGNCLLYASGTTTCDLIAGKAHPDADGLMVANL